MSDLEHRLDDGSAYYAPATSRHRNGRGLSQGQEAAAALRGEPDRPIWRQRPLCRRALRDRRRRGREDRRDRTERRGQGQFPGLGRCGEGVARSVQGDRRKFEVGSGAPLRRQGPVWVPAFAGTQEGWQVCGETRLCLHHG